MIPSLDYLVLFVFISTRFNDNKIMGYDNGKYGKCLEHKTP